MPSRRTPDSNGPPPFANEWVELAQELRVTELRRLVSFYNRGVRSGLPPTSPRRVLELMRAGRRRVRLAMAQIERSVEPTKPPPPAPLSLNCRHRGVRRGRTRRDRDD